MSDERDKVLVRKSVTEALAFLQPDKQLAMKIITGQLQTKKTHGKATHWTVALCAAALLCLILWNWPAQDDLLLNGNTAAQSPDLQEMQAFTPREWRIWCPQCDKTTLWLECCMADGYTEEYNQQSALLYHQANGKTCGYYQVYALNCRFCTACGNVYVLSDSHMHAVVHLNCGGGTACPCAAYWEQHGNEYPAYRKALERYNHK